MLIVELGPDASVLVLDVALQARAGKHLFGNLELQCFEDGLVIEEARELDASDQLLHVD